MNQRYKPLHYRIPETYENCLALFEDIPKHSMYEKKTDDYSVFATAEPVSYKMESKT